MRKASKVNWRKGNPELYLAKRRARREKSSKNKKRLQGLGIANRSKKIVKEKRKKQTGAVKIKNKLKSKKNKRFGNKNKKK